MLQPLPHRVVCLPLGAIDLHLMAHEMPACLHHLPVQRCHQRQRHQDARQNTEQPAWAQPLKQYKHQRNRQQQGQPAPPRLRQHRGIERGQHCQHRHGHDSA